MIKNIIVVTITLLFAFSILFVSVLRTASVKYSFYGESPNYQDEQISGRSDELASMEINYYLPYEGPVTPDHPLWPLKAIRDRVWLFVTVDPYRRSELNLLFADKRLVASQKLFEKEDFETGYSTLTKAEKYLENACNVETEIRSEGGDTTELAERLINASYKHRLVIEQILLNAPADAKGNIEETKRYSIGVYDDKKTVLESAGRPVPENPFNGQ